MTKHSRKAPIGAGLITYALTLIVVGCGSDSTGPRTSKPKTEIVTAAARPISHNVLSVLVDFRTRNGDSARVSYRALSAESSRDPASDGPTPFYRITSDSGSIAALGLRADTQYELTLQVAGEGGDTSAIIPFHTGSLPQSLIGLKMNVTGAPTAGYTLTEFTAPGKAYIVAFNQSGALAWYRSFDAKPGESALNAEQQANGDFTVFVGASTGWQSNAGNYYQVTAVGDSVGSFGMAAPFYTDPHELLLDFTGGTFSRSHILGYDFRTVDLTSIGGKFDQLVAGHVIVRKSALGQTEFVWSAWDHFTIADWVYINPGLANMASTDFDHPNSIERDGNGNYLVSFANLGEITKIDGVSGAMLWRFGGRHNQFSFVDDPLGGFGSQHDARLLANGNLLLMDNGQSHRPQESRAAEYRLDLATHTATLVWEYRHSPAVFSPFAGSVQRLLNGNTLVAFGAAAQIVELSAAGNVLWEAKLMNDGSPVPFLYRARRIGSLYRHEAR